MHMLEYRTSPAPAAASRAIAGALGLVIIALVKAVTG